MATALALIVPAITAAAPYIAAAGTAISAGGTVLQGYRAKKSAEEQERFAQVKATETRAITQRQRDEERRAGERVMSRQIAVAAASGAGVYNPTVLDIVGDTKEQSAFKQAAITFQGESKARGLMRQAALGVEEGKATFAGSILQGVGQAATDFAMFKRHKLFEAGAPDIS